MESNIRNTVTTNEMGAQSESLWAAIELVDWLVRVFGPFVLVDIPYKLIFVWTITLYGCMNRHYHYTLFYSQS